MKIASVLENQKIEKRIAITPEIAKKYMSIGFQVLLPENYGTHLGITDDKYKDIGVKILKDENIVIDFEKCTNNKKIEDFVLNDRIEGVKKFKVNATPTIIINNKKFDKSLNYKNLKKSIEKLI